MTRDALPQQQYQNGESEENHEQFLKALQNAVTTFLNRMKSNHMRGRSITNDSAVLSLFQSINNMHPQLLELLNQLDEKRRESTPSRLITLLSRPLCLISAMRVEFMTCLIFLNYTPETRNLSSLARCLVTSYKTPTRVLNTVPY